MSERYNRQTSLTEIGISGQQKLASAHIAVVGCGGLGSIAVPYLAAAGIGKLTLIDGDKPQLSNVHRQVFFDGTETISKAESLAHHIRSLNPEVRLTVHGHMLSKSNIEASLAGADLVLECTDDMMTKYLVNDYCHIHGIPLVYGSIYKFEGYVSVFENKDADSIHLRDIFPEPDMDIPSCSEVGVMNTIAGMIGLQQANEALKYVMEIGELATNKLLTINCLTNDQYSISLRKTYSDDLQAVYDSSAYQIVSCELAPEITFDSIKNRMSEYRVISILENHEHQSIHELVEHMPLSGFDSSMLDMDKPIVIYCLSGKRSSQLVEKLILEYPHVAFYSLAGGLITQKNGHG